jgi:hypothetical protein
MPVDAPDVALEPVDGSGLVVAAVGWADELELDELEVEGAVWLGGLLTLIVGPLCDGAIVFGLVVCGIPKIHTSAIIARIARITPRTTPVVTPPPSSVEPGGDELI